MGVPRECAPPALIGALSVRCTYWEGGEHRSEHARTAVRAPTVQPSSCPSHLHAHCIADGKLSGVQQPPARRLNATRLEILEEGLVTRVDGLGGALLRVGVLPARVGMGEN